MQILHYQTNLSSKHMKNDLKLFPLWELYTDEKAVSLCQTSLDTDYRQVRHWLSRCPFQEPGDLRKAMGWVLKQEPRLSAIKVGRYVKAMARWAAAPDVRLLEYNPVQSFQFPKRPQKEIAPTVIKTAELSVILNAFTKLRYSDYDWRKPTLLQLQLGLRTGEVFAIHKDDIQNGKLYVHRNWTLTRGLKESTKTNKSRNVPINSVAMEILQQLTPDPDGFLLPWSRKSYETFFYLRMKKLFNNGMISNRYRPYDLRHTALSQWLEHGVPVTQVASWAGNSSAVIWANYANTTQSYDIPVIM